MVSERRPNLTPRSPNSGNDARKQTLIITAISLFAFSGLLVGFVVGAMTRSHATTSTSNSMNTSPVVNQHTMSPTPQQTAATQVVPLGYPAISQFSATEVADGTTKYTLKAYPVDQSTDKGHGKPVHASNITCKIWLTKSANVTNDIQGAGDRLHNVDTLAQPFPKEAQGALNFVGTNETQTCNPDGDTSWQYQIAPTVKPGTYYIVVLTDWIGQRYNWSWINITVTNNANNGNQNNNGNQDNGNNGNQNNNGNQ